MTRNPTSAGNAGVWRVIKNANAGGVVDFPVALAVDGVWVLESTGSTGAVLGTQTVTVADHGAVIVGDASAGSDTAAAAGAGSTGGAVTGGTAATGQLSRTGFQGMGLAMGGGLFVLLGAGAVLVARRGRWAQPPT